MPELPEAETIRCQLEREIVGKAVRRLQIHDSRIAREHESPEQLASLVERRKIQGVGRRGKAPLIFLDGKKPTTLIFRLGMTGLLRVVPAKDPLEKSTVATLILSDGKHLRFLDQRRFGGLIARPGHDVNSTPEFDHYGPEPFSEDFTPEYLKEAFSRRSAKLEMVLMDQQVIGGIGKIYADEICFRAGLRPGRSVARHVRSHRRARPLVQLPVGECPQVLFHFGRLHGLVVMPAIRCSRAKSPRARAKCWRARCRRLITVPIGTPSTSAIS